MFSKERDIIPFIDSHWEGMTTMPRRVTQSWHLTVRCLGFSFITVCYVVRCSKFEINFHVIMFWCCALRITIQEVSHSNCHIYLNARQRLWWSRGSTLPLSTQVRRFKPGRSHQDFQGQKIVSVPSFRGEVKLSVPCCRFMACKRFLNVAWKLTFRQNHRLIFSPTSSTFHCLDLSCHVGRRDVWRRKWEHLKHNGG